jgi:DNA-directed RNA polymerase subunit M/transcription elongation factor TFIIS
MNSNDNDMFRNNIVLKFDIILKDLSLSRKFEQSIYNYIIEKSMVNNIIRSWDNDTFKNLYILKISSFYNNLNKDSYLKNYTFYDRILSGEITPSNINKLHLYDINPNSWIELINKKLKSDKIKNELKPTAMTNLYRCSRCKSRECSFYEVQTRSADEPMTQFITCLKCNNRWRQ